MGKYEMMRRVTYRIIRLSTVETTENRMLRLHFKRLANIVTGNISLVLNKESAYVETISVRLPVVYE
jgi:hypothetical protein